MRKKIVTIGGGTGQYVLLNGLKNRNVELCTVVSMADDGGTTGILRDELGALPPSDVRKCIIALSHTTPLMRELFSYRFPNKNLEGHTVGNLIISALEKITGDFTSAILEAGKIFNIRGKILPVTNEDMRLRVHLKNGDVLEGERLLDDNPKVWKFGVDKISITNTVHGNKDALKEIESADLIVIGPGDLYGSIAPNFLVNGIAKSIVNSRARVLYVANLTNKKGQTNNFNACNYLEKINEYLGEERVDVLLCNSTEPNKYLKYKYEQKEGADMFVDCSDCDSSQCNVVRVDLLSNIISKTQHGDTLAHTRSFIRHDSKKLADAIIKLL